MRFLLFNLSVLAALAYLFNGGADLPLVKVAGKAAQPVHAEAKQAPKITPEKAPEAELDKPAPNQTEKPLIDQPEAAPPIPEPKEVAARPVNSTPPPELVEPSSQAPKRAPRAKAVVTHQSTPNFMSPAERRRELQRLAQDMEGFFFGSQ